MKEKIENKLIEDIDFPLTDDVIINDNSVIIFSEIDVDEMDINDCIYLMDNDFNMYFDGINYDEKKQKSSLIFRMK